MTKEEKQEYKYKAFISYSHKDEKWGKWLHKKLETYGIDKNIQGRETFEGTVPARLFPIFRDREELPTASDLGRVISNALDDSNYLIVICSPNSAKSKWVNEEIKYFKKLGRQNKIISLIVDGEPNANEKNGCELVECFPPALKVMADKDGNLTKTPAEPIAADVREEKDGKNNAFLKIVSGLIGVGFDELNRRDLKRKKRKTRAIVSCLLLISFFLTSVSYNAIKAEGEAQLSFDSSVSQYNFLSSIFLSSIDDTNLNNFSRDDLKALVHILKESSKKMEREEDKIKKGKLYGKNLLYRLRIHKTLGESFENLEYIQEAIFHFKKSIEVLKESKVRKLARRQWGVIPIYEPELPSSDIEIEILEKKIELLELIYENGIYYRGRKENDTIVLSSNTKEGIEALRDEKINAIHKKWISLFYDFKILQAQTFNNNFNQEKYNEILKKFENLKKKKLFWSKEEQHLMDSRFLSLSAAGNAIHGLTLLEISKNYHVEDKKSPDYLMVLQNARRHIRLACDDNKNNNFSSVFEEEKLELVEYAIESYNNYLRMKMVEIDIYINKYLNHIERVNSLKIKLENMEADFIKRDINKLSRGEKFYGEWTSCLMNVAKDLKDFNLLKETSYKDFKFKTNKTNINTHIGDISKGWGLLLLYSIVSEDVQKLNAIAEYLEDSESFIYPFAKAMIGDVKNYLIYKKSNESESIESGAVKPGYSIINPLDNPNKFFESDINVENRLIIFEDELNNYDEDFYKNIFTKMDFDLFKINYKKEYITKTFKLLDFRLRLQKLQIGNNNVEMVHADKQNILSILLKNNKFANFVINDLSIEDISDLDDSNISLVQYLIAHGEDEFNDELLLKLIEKGIDINKKDKWGDTPLHFAANEGKLNLLKLIIKSGAELNMRNNLGQNPLFLAVVNNDLEMAKYLINIGSEINHISTRLYYFDGIKFVTKEIECTALDQLENNYELVANRSYLQREALKDFIEFFKEAGGKSINDLAN